MTNNLIIGDASGAVQRAIYKKLSATAIGGPVFDTPPTGTPRPYIVIGTGYLIPNNTKDIKGFNAFITIDAWDDAPSFNPLKTITSAITELLSAGDLAPNTEDAQKYIFLNCEIEKIEHLTDEDGRTKHGIINLIINLQKK